MHVQTKAIKPLCNEQVVIIVMPNTCHYLFVSSINKLGASQSSTFLECIGNTSRTWWEQIDN
jgi:hypothetical protein